MNMDPWGWFNRLDPAIQAAWIGVVGALIGALLGAFVGAYWASKSAERVARNGWAREAEARAEQRKDEDRLRKEQRREEQLEDLAHAWADLHASANRGSWFLSPLMGREPTDDETERLADLWTDFWHHCKLVSARARALGFPAAAEVLYELHHFDGDDLEARFVVAAKVAELYIERPLDIEQRAAANPKKWVSDLVALSTRETTTDA